MSQILAAILWLVPHLSQNTASQYAQLIYDTADRHGIEPLLVVAVTHRESRFNKNAYSKKNYGLMQVRVSKNVHSKYLGKEKLLFDPCRNIHAGVAMMAYWKGYHHRRCWKKKAHPWWSHYQWGRKVKNTESGVRVKELYHELKLRFEKRDEV